MRGLNFAVDNVPTLAPATVTRTVYRLELVVDRLLDLRDPRLWQALSLSNAPFYFTDRAVARATARFLRYTTQAQGLLVPSVAFLDQPDRWVLALFLEKLPADPRAFIPVVDEVGQGFATAMRVLDLGRLSLAARCLGTMEECLQLSVEHARRRVQFK